MSGTTKQYESAMKARKMLRALPGYDRYDPRSNVVDAMTNLRHLCERSNIDFFAALDMSYQHYLAERPLSSRQIEAAQRFE